MISGLFGGIIMSERSRNEKVGGLSKVDERCDDDTLDAR